MLSRWLALIENMDGYDTQSIIPHRKSHDHDSLRSGHSTSFVVKVKWLLLLRIPKSIPINLYKYFILTVEWDNSLFIENTPITELLTLVKYIYAPNA